MTRADNTDMAIATVVISGEEEKVLHPLQWRVVLKLPLRGLGDLPAYATGQQVHATAMHKSANQLINIHRGCLPLFVDRPL